MSNNSVIHAVSLVVFFSLASFICIPFYYIKLFFGKTWSNLIVFFWGGVLMAIKVIRKEDGDEGWPTSKGD